MDDERESDHQVGDDGSPMTDVTGSRDAPAKGGARFHTSSESSNDGADGVAEDLSRRGDSVDPGAKAVPTAKKPRSNGGPLLQLDGCGAGHVPESPPRFVSLDQIMKAANGVTNMMLAHEIALDDKFVLKEQELPERSLEKQVKEILHQAFWDVLDKKLKEDPPNYDQAMQLLQDIKEALLSLLLPRNTRLRAEIEEVLDVALVRQQAEHGALDFDHYARFVVSVMARICAPVRDSSIRELLQIKEVVPLFRGIMTQLDLMKGDMVNFTIQQARPLIQSQSISYEQTKFKDYLEAQTMLDPSSDPLVHTKAWLRRSYNELRDLSIQYSPDPINGPGSTGPGFSRVLAKAYVQLLSWDTEWEYPETLAIDQSRYMALKDEVQLSTLVASVLLVTYSVGGAALQGISDFKEDLKAHVQLLLEGATTCSEEELREKLKNVAAQVIKDVQECLHKHGYNPMNLSQERLLYDQIGDMASPEHRVRKLLLMRILEFVELAISSATARPTKIPPGLSTLEKELTSITGCFLRLVTHNRAVFSEYYSDIVTQLRAA